MTRDDLNRVAIALAEVANDGAITVDIPVGESFIVMAVEAAGYTWSEARGLIDMMVKMKILDRDDAHGITAGERLPLVQASLAAHKGRVTA